MDYTYQSSDIIDHSVFSRRANGIVDGFNYLFKILNIEVLLIQRVNLAITMFKRQ